jgi:hypothetical protein
MKLAEENNLPAFSLDRRFQRYQRPISQQFPLEPLPPDPSANEKRNCRAYDVSNQGDEESPPEPKEKTGADTKDAAREEEDVAAGIEQRVTDRAPCAPFHDAELHGRQNVHDREKP